MRRILIEIEKDGSVKVEHERRAQALGAKIAKITGEADIYPLHKKILRTPDGLRHACVIIVSTYLKNRDEEKVVLALIATWREEWKMFEIRFNLEDEA